MRSYLFSVGVGRREETAIRSSSRQTTPAEIIWPEKSTREATIRDLSEHFNLVTRSLTKKAASVAT